MTSRLKVIKTQGRLGTHRMPQMVCGPQDGDYWFISYVNIKSLHMNM